MQEVTRSRLQRLPPEKHGLSGVHFEKQSFDLRLGQKRNNSSQDSARRW
jgi:hypothetical protein